MTPNLTRLFLDRKDAPYPVAADADGKLMKLFNDHGEALIAALGEVQSYLHARNLGQPAKDLDLKLTALLAQLESEAQP